MSSTRARIAIDAMGGDHAPAEIVAGALIAQEKWDVEVFLVGDPDQIEAALKHHHSKLCLKLFRLKARSKCTKKPWGR